MTAPMSGEHLRKIRKALGVTAWEFGLALGYSGPRGNVQTTVRRYESGARPIPPTVARLAAMFQMHGIPPGFIDKPRPPRLPE